MVTLKTPWTLKRILISNQYSYSMIHYRVWKVTRPQQISKSHSFLIMGHNSSNHVLVSGNWNRVKTHLKHSHLSNQLRPWVLLITMLFIQTLVLTTLAVWLFQKDKKTLVLDCHESMMTPRCWVYTARKYPKILRVRSTRIIYPFRSRSTTICWRTLNLIHHKYWQRTLTGCITQELQRTVN